MKSLFTPWRYAYLISPKPQETGCIFCQAHSANQDESMLVVYRGVHNFIILNKYPYTNGHLMIVPNLHVPSPGGSTAAQRAEMIDLAATCESILRLAYNAEGINMGMNLGKAAGAGIEEHYHLHVLPRWAGDTNFMAATADTRIIPEDLALTRGKLAQALGERLGRSPSGTPNA